MIMGSSNEGNNNCGDLSNETEADLLEDVYLYLTKRQYREGLTQNQKKIVRKKATNFYVADGEMVYKKKLKAKNETYFLAA